MLARVATFAVDGVDARRVWVEADIRQGLPAFTVVGLADKAVREARERVRAAMVNSGYEFPLRRITVNLAPAYLRKVGPAFDLPLAVALLVASYQLEPDDGRGLRGRRRAVADGRGAADPRRARGRRGRPPRRVAAARASRARGRARPRSCPDIEVARHRLAAGAGRDAARRRRAASRCRTRSPTPGEPEAELADVRGHNGLIPGLEVAAAGGHNLFLQGPPGTGKTMIARRLPVDPAAARARRGDRGHAHPVGRRPARRGAGLVTARPFRAPHHTVSAAGLVGGANPPQPGEATLAHRGVLFLDELSEFARPSLEALRQPLEDGHVTIVRGQQVMVFPTRFMLVAASNPCPCGLGDARCQCSQADLVRHRRRLSGPLLDRDRHPDARRAPARRGPAPADRPDLGRGARARGRRPRAPAAAAWPASRRSATPSSPRARSARSAASPPSALRLLGELYDRHTLSARGHTRILRVARTVADLDGSDVVGAEHVNIAASLRLDDAHQLAEAA